MNTEVPEDESRRKRLKVSEDVSSEQTAPPSNSTDPSTTAPRGTDQSELDNAQALKEAEVGITDFVSADLPGFSGIVKKRYTDFLVNEISLAGKVLHLRNLALPPSLAQDTKRPEAATGKEEKKGPSEEQQTTEPVDSKQQDGKAPQNGSDKSAGDDKGAPSDTPDLTISDEDRKLLDDSFGASVIDKVINLYKRALNQTKGRPSDLGKVKSASISDKDARTALHQLVRRVFANRIETRTDDDGGIMFSAASQRSKPGPPKARGEVRKGKLGWSDLGGEYLHFTIYKENKDTMEVISFLARQMKLSPKYFHFAGTKDKRGVTVQRASAFRVDASRLLTKGKTLRNAAIGDFEYQGQQLELGDLRGNEFVITLRECEFPEKALQGLTGPDRIEKVSEVVSKSLRALHERGYFNYYGLQRFGTFATRTDMVGLQMLKGDFQGACESILRVSPDTLAAIENQDTVGSNVRISSDDKSRAEAIRMFQTTGKANDALEKLPRKFTAETTLIRQLGRNKNDYYGALQAIPRNLRLIYVHAYQSLVWNFAVGERWRLYGDKVVEGDLVLEQATKAAEAPPPDDVDADGDVIVLPDAGDSAPSVDDVAPRARPLSADEAASGSYGIFDIVLPLPGFDVIYPPNKMMDFYKEFMASDKGGNLDPFNMHRKWKEISLAGTYRKVLSRPLADYSFEVKAHSDDNEQFAVTDLEKINGDTNTNTRDTNPDPDTSKKLAVIINFQLGASQYATMALRELMKSGGAKNYQPEFGIGRS